MKYVFNKDENSLQLFEIVDEQIVFRFYGSDNRCLSLYPYELYYHNKFSPIEFFSREDGSLIAAALLNRIEPSSEKNRLLDYFEESGLCKDESSVRKGKMNWD